MDLVVAGSSPSFSAPFCSPRFRCTSIRPAIANLSTRNASSRRPSLPRKIWELASIRTGGVVARIITTQFEFVPNCIVLPADRDVTLRFATPDVIHGILITGTNVNTMVIPGYVAQVHSRFTKPGDLLMPCHEYCGLGHSQMIATVRVVSPDQFRPDSKGRVSCGDDR